MQPKPKLTTEPNPHLPHSAKKLVLNHKFVYTLLIFALIATNLLTFKAGKSQQPSVNSEIKNTNAQGPSINAEPIEKYCDKERTALLKKYISVFFS